MKDFIAHNQEYKAVIHDCDDTKYALCFMFMVQAWVTPLLFVVRVVRVLCRTNVVLAIITVSVMVVYYYNCRSVRSFLFSMYVLRGKGLQIRVYSLTLLFAATCNHFYLQSCRSLCHHPYHHV